ncbi:carotenoid ester lipase precursor [Mucidula mucida]|nr:carotenoid ester lipase precursor [Mucidula mucida]
MLTPRILLIVLQTALVLGARCPTQPTFPAWRPTVCLDKATVTGTHDGPVSKFLGIPYGQPPTGELRFQLPKAVDAYTGRIDATSRPPACPQQAVKFEKRYFPRTIRTFVLNTILAANIPSSEDCLTIDVIAPKKLGTRPLPVVVWIFGGGFEIGGTRMYDGTGIVRRSIKLGEPMIYVAMNYRVSAYGFLAGKEVKDAKVGNLGLHDQRLALKWVQKYIGQFGGDPTKVTLWGQSAGAISVSLHMLMNDGNHEGLFRGAFMQSGAPIPVGDLEHGQRDYDDIVQRTNCGGWNDTLACLRHVDYEKLKKAVDASPFLMEYRSLILAWLPRTDGVLFSDNPQRLVLQGKVANIPFEPVMTRGPYFHSLSTMLRETNEDFRTYVRDVMLPTAPDADVDRLVDPYPRRRPRDLYDNDQSVLAESPSDADAFSMMRPQFKRLATFQGDVVFQAPRRFFISALSGKQDVYTFIYKRLKTVAYLRSFHTADLIFNSKRQASMFPPHDMQDYLVHFVTHLDPNGDGKSGNKNLIHWPRYNNESQQMLSFNVAPTGIFRLLLTVTEDTFREAEMSAVSEVYLEHPI